MATSKPVTVGGLYFCRQKDALNHFSSMLSKYNIGSIIEGGDASELGALLAMHREFSEKKGDGIEFLTTTISEQGSKCFAVMRVDGTVAGFSFHRCITQKW